MFWSSSNDYTHSVGLVYLRSWEVAIRQLKLISVALQNNWLCKLDGIIANAGDLAPNIFLQFSTIFTVKSSHQSLFGFCYGCIVLHNKIVVNPSHNHYQPIWCPVVVEIQVCVTAFHVHILYEIW